MAPGGWLYLAGLQQWLAKLGGLDAMAEKVHLRLCDTGEGLHKLYEVLYGSKLCS